jgi:hypothetical protein
MVNIPNINLYNNEEASFYELNEDRVHKYGLYSSLFKINHNHFRTYILF